MPNWLVRPRLATSTLPVRGRSRRVRRRRTPACAFCCVHRAGREPARAAASRGRSASARPEAAPAEIAVGRGAPLVGSCDVRRSARRPLARRRSTRWPSHGVGRPACRRRRPRRSADCFHASPTRTCVSARGCSTAMPACVDVRRRRRSTSRLDARRARDELWDGLVGGTVSRASRSCLRRATTCSARSAPASTSSSRSTAPTTGSRCRSRSSWLGAEAVIDRERLVADALRPSRSRASRAPRRRWPPGTPGSARSSGSRCSGSRSRTGARTCSGRAPGPAAGRR